jgi:hypothetical protein
MFFFPWRRTGNAADATRQAAPELIPLAASRIALGVAFHLVDEGLAGAVDTASRDAAARGLDERGVRLAIGKEQWLALDNAQRLRWLLAHVPIDVTIGPDRVAVLKVKGGPPGGRNRSPSPALSPR